MTLPFSKRNIEVVTFDFEQIFLSILSNEELISTYNLLFENGYQFHTPPRRAHIISEVNTVSWYINAYKHLCHNYNDILVPIILLIDGVTVYMYSHLCLEPVTFTLGIINRSTINKASSWRTLGLINDLNLTSSNKHRIKKNPGDNLRDLHSILKEILTPLVQLQRKGGFQWEFHING